MTSASLPQPRFRASRTLRAIVVGLAVSCTAPALADNLPDAQRFIKRGQYEQALEKVDAQLRETPDDAQARFLKGVIYTETDRTAEAIAVFTKLTEDYLHAKQASQAYAKAVQLDAGSKTAKAKLALARDLIARPAKPAPIPAAQPAEAVAAPARTENASSETSR